MAKVTSTEKLLDLIKRSGLLDSTQLDQAVEVVKRGAGGSLPADPNLAAQCLIEHKFITRWQAGKLLEGRFKGFYWENYCFLGRQADHETYTTYITKDTDTGKRVVVAVTPPQYCDNPHGELRVIEEVE